MEKAFFLDKDGTLTKYVIYSNPAKAREILEDEIIFDKVVDGLKYIQEKGYKLIIVSNQPWVSKGIVKNKDIDKLFKNLVKNLKKKGIHIDDYYFCPHSDIDNCKCRKPKSGMILDASRKHNIDLNQSYIVGDGYKDILAGEKAGLKTVFVLTGGANKLIKDIESDYTLDSINSLKEII